MPSQNDARTSVFSFDPDELFPPEKLAAAYDNAVKAVRLLLARIRELEAFIAAMPTDDAAELRVIALEAEIAMLRGTMAQPMPDEPTTYADNLLPNAPPHGERPPDNPK